MFEVKQNGLDRIMVKLNSDTRHISQLTEIVEDFVKKYLSQKDAYEVAVAVDEAVTNIMLHAYQKNTEGRINIQLFQKADEVCVEIEDFGKRFIPPLVVEKKKFTFDQLEGGGLGLYLMEEFMDELRFLYDEDDHKNIIVMKKYLIS